MNLQPETIITDRPAWLAVLDAECEKTSQAKVAAVLNISTAQISQARKGTYPGNLARLEAAVRGAYMGETVNCPVLGELDKNKCQQHQRQKMTAVNPLRVRLYRACNGGCANSAKSKGDV